MSESAILMQLYSSVMILADKPPEDFKRLATENPAVAKMLYQAIKTATEAINDLRDAPSPPKKDSDSKPKQVRRSKKGNKKAPEEKAPSKKAPPKQNRNHVPISDIKRFMQVCNSNGLVSFSGLYSTGTIPEDDYKAMINFLHDHKDDADEIFNPAVVELVESLDYHPIPTAVITKPPEQETAPSTAAPPEQQETILPRPE